MAEKYFNEMKNQEFVLPL